VAPMAVVRAERLEDIVETLLRVEPGETRSSRCWPVRFMHSRAKRERSEQKMVSVV